MGAGTLMPMTGGGLGVLMAMPAASKEPSGRNIDGKAAGCDQN
jgi:hypothetical protein